MIFYVLIALVCLFLSAIFSAGEMAFSSANRIRLENLAEAGKPGAAMAVRIIDRFDDTLSAVLISNNFANTALSSVASVIAITAFGEQYTWLATVIVTATVIIFGETMPKIVAKKNANRLSLAFAPLLRGLSLLLKPVTFLIVGLVQLIARNLKGEEENEPEAAVEELQSIIETAEDEEVIDEERSELLHAALDFDEVSASEAMTVRMDIVAVDVKDSWEEIYKTIGESNYSRIPVYEGSIDNIIGILLVNRLYKSMIGAKRAPNLRRMLMKPCHVYKAAKLPAVLEQLRRAKQHMAVVTDEYGGICGVITMEDVLEQLVGEIWDETDEVEETVVERSDGVWELDGDMPIGDFAELLGISEDSFESESATVGGWTLERFGGFPGEGGGFRWNGYAVTVLRMNGLRVERLLVRQDLPEEN